MADQLYFSRDTKVFMKQDSNVWEIPVLDGFSFSQATNASEITLNEMSSTAGVSRRARQMFNDSYAPAEWSFSTYARPFTAVGESTKGWELTTQDNVHAVEEALLANFVAANTWSTATDNWTYGVSSTTTSMEITFADSNTTTLGEFELYFVLGGCDNASGTPTYYRIQKCVANSLTVNFDIDGIATLEWSGFGSIISEEDTAPIATITEAITSTSNFIRNRLTTLAVVGDGDTFESSYDVVLTGGSISFENNITFLTPETLCVVNHPIGHVTGTRTIGGSFTAYLNAETGSTADLFEDLIEATTTITNSFGLTFAIGGSGTPRIEIALPQCHLEVPTHSIDDVISIETNFHALPSTIDETDEATITYYGTTY